MADYDFFVIGGGSGGVRAARIAGRHGAKVGLAEADRVGGTCVLRGCVPKKLMVFAARYPEEFAESVAYGWNPGEPTFDWTRLTHNIASELDRLSKLYVRGLENAGVEILHDRATIDGPGRVRLEGSGRVVTAKNILIATGGHPNRPADVPGVEHCITSDDMFDLPALPKRILIVGAGYVAIEFASIMRGLGVETTILHRGDHLLRGFDAEIQSTMLEHMQRRGIGFVFEDELAAVEKGPSGLRAKTRSNRTIDADQILLAMGRSPNIGRLGIEQAGVDLYTDGSIAVDKHSKTTAEGIYAVGDVTNRINLTPVAIREGHVLADRLFAGSEAVVSHRDVPHAVFGLPEIGVVGLSEEQALEEFSAVDIYRSSFLPMKSQFGGHDDRMMMKLVVEAVSGRLLGCHMLGPGAAELVQLVAIAVKMGATKADLDATMALHPTSAEELVTMREPARQHRRAAAE